MTPVKVSLVIPAYNSVRYLGENVDRILAFYEAAGIDGEVIVADDGSTDGTADSLTTGDRVRVLRLPHGGKGAAVRAKRRVREIAATDADCRRLIPPLAMTCIGSGAMRRDRRPHAAGLHVRQHGASDGRSNLASLSFRTLVTGGIYDTQ
jgi:hypothetical protein